jgi:hypothetical protein
LYGHDPAGDLFFGAVCFIQAKRYLDFVKLS